MSGRSRKDCPGAVRRSVGRCGEAWWVKHHTYTSSFSLSQRRVGSWAAAWRNSLSYRRQCEAGYCKNSMASIVWYLASSRASWGYAARRVHRYRFHASVQEVKSTTERSSLALRPWVRLGAGPAMGGVSEGRRRWSNFTYLPLWILDSRRRWRGRAQLMAAGGPHSSELLRERSW